MHVFKTPVQFSSIHFIMCCGHVDLVDLHKWLETVTALVLAGLDVE